MDIKGDSIVMYIKSGRYAYGPKVSDVHTCKTEYIHQSTH